MRRFTLVIALFTITWFAHAADEEGVTIFFDGAEGTIINETTDFEFGGAELSGGKNISAGVPKFYVSFPAGYSFSTPGGGEVTFDPPVSCVSFNFVHGEGTNRDDVRTRIRPGNALVRGDSRAPLAVLKSNLADTPGNPANVVSLESDEPIQSIRFTGGLVDNLSFTPVEE